MRAMTLIAAALLLPVGAFGAVTAGDSPSPPSSTRAPASSIQAPPSNIDQPTPTSISDPIATVGDQSIYFSEINVALNSSAVVGISIPALGTPQRDTARITLLDRFISANLLYLDALKQGTDQDPGYRRAVERFSTAILAGLYRKRSQTGVIEVSEPEVLAWYRQNMASDVELTDPVRLQIESRLRRDKLHARLAEAGQALRNGVAVTVYEQNLAIDGDAGRADDTPMAEVGAETLRWGDVKGRIIAAGSAAVAADPLDFEAPARRLALEREIDLRIMAQKARAAGLDQDPLYRKRLGEFRKTLLTNLHRKKLVQQLEPDLAELEAYYQANRHRFMVPESRKLQMVVVKTRGEAERIRGAIAAGETTLYLAARDHSLAVNAAQDLGEVGWVNRGDLAPGLDAAVFALMPGQVSQPVESPAGWHVVLVQEVKDARNADFDDPTTRRLTRRRYLHQKIGAYTAELRRSQFPVQVYQDRLMRLSQREADLVKALAAKSREPGSVTRQRIEEMQALMQAR